MKKVVSLVLVLALICSLGITAFAASDDPVVAGDLRGAAYTDVAGQKQPLQEAIYALTALGVLEGDGLGTSFRPTDTLTRAEFAKIMYFFAGYTEDDLKYFESIDAAFPDTVAGTGYGWAEGYINGCAQKGIFIGYEDGTFRPGNIVTNQEVATALLRLVGYNDELPGEWPYDYNIKAVNVGMTKYVDYVGGAPAKRADVASLAYQTLGLWLVTYIEDPTAAGIGYVNYDVDADGFAYKTFMTNEGDKIFMTLGDDVFGLKEYTVTYAPEATRGEDKAEASGWNITDLKKGQLELCFADGSSCDLASTYYLVGCNLVDLGGTTGKIFVKDGEIVLATSNKDYKDKAYFDAYKDDYFGIFDRTDTYKGDTYIVFKGIGEQRPSANKYANEVFWSVTQEKFIGIDELVEGDVLYWAGPVDKTDLILVYSPIAGEFTEITNGKPGVPGVATVDGVDYTYGATAYSIDNGKTFDWLDYDVIEDNVEIEGDVNYVVGYAGNLAYIAADLVEDLTPVIGVVTGYTTTMTVVNLMGGEVGPVWQLIDGITLFTEEGKTVTYKFTTPGLFAPNKGDLLQVFIDDEDVIRNGRTLVFFDPDDMIVVGTNAAESRINIYGDWWTLNKDAVIFDLTADRMGQFTGVTLATADEVLARGTQKTEQVSFRITAIDTNEIDGLYFVNRTGLEVKKTGIAVKASIKNGEATIKMLDGTEYTVAPKAEIKVWDGTGFASLDWDAAWELFKAGVPSLISFFENEDGTIFNIELLVNEEVLNEEGVAENFPAYALARLTYISGDQKSVRISGRGFNIDVIKERAINPIVLSSQTLFTKGATYYDFKTAKELTINDFEVGDPVLVIYDSATHEIIYMFPADATLTYYLNDEVYKTEEYGAGDRATVIALPEVEGADVDGWYDDYDDEYDEGDSFYVEWGGSNLYAEFDYDEYDVYWWDYDAEEDEYVEIDHEYDVEYPETITMPAAPEKENFEFQGWLIGEDLYEAGAEVAIKDLVKYDDEGNLDFNAQWKGVDVPVLVYIDTAAGVREIKGTGEYGQTVEDWLKDNIEDWEDITWTTDIESTFSNVQTANIIYGSFGTASEGPVGPNPPGPGGPRP